MKKQVRLVLSAVLALSLVGAFAMFGCSSNTTTTEKKDDAAKTEQAEPVELQVFAANSLSKAMEDIQKAYIEDGHDNVTFKDTQYKSSGELNEDAWRRLLCRPAHLRFQGLHGHRGFQGLCR